MIYTRELSPFRNKKYLTKSNEGINKCRTKETSKDYFRNLCRLYIILTKKYPKLTEEDILYLCLNEAKLQPLTIALCFGYNNTHPINQRKLRIKEKMKDEEM